MSNVIQYTSRTYQTILNDINSIPELRDKPNWWKNIWAGVGDVLNVYLNAQANNSYLRTAFTRQAVEDLCNLIDYYLTPQQPASGTLVYNFVDGFIRIPYTLAVSAQTAITAGNLAESAKQFEGRTTVYTIWSGETFTVNVADDIINIAGVRTYNTGMKLKITSSVTVPSPLVNGEFYYAIEVSNLEIRLAETIEDALNNNYITLTDAGTGTRLLAPYGIANTAYQQKTIESYIAGKANGTEEWQEIPLADKDIIRETLRVTINSVEWEILGTGSLSDNFVNSEPSDKHVRLIYDTDNNARLRFGNGVYGAIPGSYDVYVQYAVGGGSSSNTSSGRINLYQGDEDDIETVVNPYNMTGGADKENIEAARILAPILLKTRDRFITVEDGQALIQNYGGISQSEIIKNFYGTLSCKIITIASGGGNPSSGVKSALQTYLIDRTVLASIDVRVVDTTITAVNITAAIKVLGGYTYSDIETYIELAFKLLLSETGKEIYDKYNQEGIEETVALINTIFGTSYELSDYEQIEKLVANLNYREIGRDVQQSDVIGFVDIFVDGVDYLTISAPSFPISIDDDEITTDGTINLSEI